MVSYSMGTFILRDVIFILPIIILLLGSGCTNDLEIRKTHWEEELEMFDPVGKRKDELLSWLSKQHIEPYADKSDLGAILEEIEGNGIVCSKWLIQLSAKLDEQSVVSSYSLETPGICL